MHSLAILTRSLAMLVCSRLFRVVQKRLFLRGHSWDTIIPGGNRFVSTWTNYIFVAKLKHAGFQACTLMVSSNGGASFEAAEIPADLDEKGCAVLWISIKVFEDFQVCS